MSLLTGRVDGPRIAGTPRFTSFPTKHMRALRASDKAVGAEALGAGERAESLLTDAWCPEGPHALIKEHTLHYIGIPNMIYIKYIT